MSNIIFGDRVLIPAGEYPMLSKNKNKKDLHQRYTFLESMTYEALKVQEGTIEESFATYEMPECCVVRIQNRNTKGLPFILIEVYRDQLLEIVE